ncbi:MAG: HAD hydrolase family protein [Candidatus Hermodarchaeota archaeon]
MASITEVFNIVDLSDYLIIFDFDDTLIHSDGSIENLGILKELKTLGVELCLATRNDLYYIEAKLEEYELTGLFTYIKADYRPKYYQIKHILYLYKKWNKFFNQIYFIDDYQPNIEQIQHHLPNVSCLVFGKDVKDISELINLVCDNRLNTLN